jgi:hypothetical protein
MEHEHTGWDEKRDPVDDGMAAMYAVMSSI